MSARSRPLVLLLAIAAVTAVAVVALLPLGKPSAPTLGPGASVVVVGGSPLLGKPAPAIALEDLDGRPVALADYAGRPVVVNFWAPWCIPCRDEFPLFVQAREAYAAQGLELLGVIYNASFDDSRRFARDQGAAWPMLKDPDQEAWDAYGGFGLPTTFFVDPGGVVRAVSYGPLTEAGFAAQVATILPRVASPSAPSPPAEG